MEFEKIIVGGGTAGCVLANRLSASSQRRVLVLEAGPDIDPKYPPACLADSYPGTAYYDSRFNWVDLKARIQSDLATVGPRGAPRKYEQGRVIGGSSSINGQQSNRGTPADYDEWAAKGAAGWNWDSVLPYFIKVERDLDFVGPLHGNAGPVVHRRVPESEWCDHARAVAAAMRAQRYPLLQDQNAEFGDGFFAPVIANENERRIAASDAYLDEKVRARPNLTVICNAFVTSLIFEGRICKGVNADVDGKSIKFTAGEVILASGAIHTPAHLLRAGIGPAEGLRKLGIPLLFELPGVGQRLMDHPSLSLASFLTPSARMKRGTRRHIQVALRYSSGIAGCETGDMFMLGVSRTAWHSIGARIGSLVNFVNKTYSETGTVTLSSRDPYTEPLVDLNLLSDARDTHRLMHGFRLMAQMQSSPELAAVTSDAFPASYSERVKRLGIPNRRNALLSSAASALIDGPQFIRRLLIDRLIREGPSVAELLSDARLLEDYVKKSVTGVWHASCTCRMGAEGDRMAVTDPSGKVRGMGGLRIADASLFPTIPRANTNLPTMMVAEKLADEIVANE